MTFLDPETGALELDAEGLWGASLPAVTCASCGKLIKRRKHRMTLRASWREETDYLCASCWYQVCRWASRFALQQMTLPRD
jgi:RNase P subunit RPR2